MLCAYAKVLLDQGSNSEIEIWRLRLHWTRNRKEMLLVGPVYIYTSVFREQQCSVVLICLYACGEVSSYTNLLQGDTNRSYFLREIMKSRTFWQGAEMSVWQADRLLYHNLIHPVRVWEDVFDELATQISKEFLACAWSSHTSGIRIHLERGDHSLSMTPFALALRFMTPRCLEGWVERWECPQLFRESRCYQTRLHHQFPDHTALF